MPSSNPLPEAPPVREAAVFGCVLHHSGRDAAWIRLSGELDLATAPQLTMRLDEALISARLVVIDLRQLTFMDSTGLAVLINAHNRARRGERRLVLIRGPLQVDRLLKLTGLADRLEITDLQSVQARPTRTDRFAPHAA